VNRKNDRKLKIELARFDSGYKCIPLRARENKDGPGAVIFRVADANAVRRQAAHLKTAAVVAAE